MAYVLSPQGGALDMASELQAFYKLFCGLDRSRGSMPELLGEGPADE
ncbi:MAG: hypothetical protein Q4E12_00555 [Coriobacteriia bacterium]|nr:hypothetical protein [Coriobacteriia bacterium]